AGQAPARERARFRATARTARCTTRTSASGRSIEGTMWTRRRVQVALVVVGSVLVARGLAIAPHARDDQPAVTAIPDFKVTLLGTGTPNPRPDRFGPSNLVEAGPERLVFDGVRSCTTRLRQLKIAPST